MLRWEDNVKNLSLKGVGGCATGLGWHRIGANGGIL
jgi:hypothetical protein